MSVREPGDDQPVEPDASGVGLGAGHNANDPLAVDLDEDVGEQLVAGPRELAPVRAHGTTRRPNSVIRSTNSSR